MSPDLSRVVVCVFRGLPAAAPCETPRRNLGEDFNKAAKVRVTDPNLSIMDRTDTAEKHVQRVVTQEHAPGAAAERFDGAIGVAFVHQHDASDGGCVRAKLLQSKQACSGTVPERDADKGDMRLEHEGRVDDMLAGHGVADGFKPAVRGAQGRMEQLTTDFCGI